jgi:hypothetical protein
MCPLKLWTGSVGKWVQEIIQNPTPQKTSEGLSPESCANVPGCPLGSEDSKWTASYAEGMGLQCSRNCLQIKWGRTRRVHHEHLTVRANRSFQFTRKASTLAFVITFPFVAAHCCPPHQLDDIAY